MIAEPTVETILIEDGIDSDLDVVVKVLDHRLTSEPGDKVIRLAYANDEESGFVLSVEMLRRVLAKVDPAPESVDIAGTLVPIESVAQAIADAIGLEVLSVRLPHSSDDTEWEGCGAEATGSRVLFDCAVPMATEDGEDYEERVTVTMLIESVRPSQAGDLQ